MHDLDSEDIATIAEILRNEHQSHCRWRSRFLALFTLFLVILLVALTLLVLHMSGLAFSSDIAARLGADVWLLPAIGTLAGAVMSFFTMWWAQQNCLHSIERTLFAAAKNRHRLFAQFLTQIQCADQKQKKLWAEILKGALG